MIIRTEDGKGNLVEEIEVPDPPAPEPTLEERVKELEGKVQKAEEDIKALKPKAL